MKTILVTGGAGFIGSNFIRWTLEHRPAYHVVNLDALTYAGNLENLEDLTGHPRYEFQKGDIRDRSTVAELFRRHDITAVVNFAAESHVDRSILEPEVFLTTNIIGTQVLLDAARQHWKLDPGDRYSRSYRPGVKFVQISTDEVYGSLGADGQFREDMPLLPNSPYSASKAGADLCVRAYHETYGLPVNITRCSNNYGPWQFPEKLIPLLISNCLKDRPIPVYGDGLQVRDWLHVADHCSAIMLVLEEGRDGEVYNIGGNNEQTNLAMIRSILRILSKSDDLIQFVKDRPGHDRRYAIDSTKISRELNWQPAHPFEKGLADTVRWYQENTRWIDRILSGDYQQYYEAMYAPAVAKVRRPDGQSGSPFTGELVHQGRKTVARRISLSP